MSLGDDISRNFASLSFDRIHHDHIAQDIIDYIAPFNLDILRVRPVGHRRTMRMYDSTATYGGFILSQFIQGAVCNSSTRWFGLKYIDEEINEQQEVQTWFKQVVTAMLQALRSSNFYEGNGQSINSWVHLGTAPLLCEMVPQSRSGLAKLCYTSIPYGQYVMSAGPDGKVDTFLRKVKLPLIVLKKMFDPKASPFNKGISAEWERACEKNPYEKQEVLQCIEPREDLYGKNQSLAPNASSLKRADQLPWASVWIEYGTKNRILRESGYRLFPVAIARYDLIAGETYGRGPSEMALPDARTLNEADRKEQLMWDRYLDPPTLTKRNSIISGVLSKRAGGDTIVTDPGTAVRPLFDTTAWQPDDMMRKRKEQAILRVYHVNEILNLLAREKPEMTAFEVNARLSLLQQIQGPVFSRLEQDYLATIVQVTLDNMAHARMLEDPPAELTMRGTDGVLTISYEGPLARAQRSQEVLDIQQSVADLASISQFDPDTVHIPDWKRVVRKLWEIRGTQDLTLNEAEFKQLMQQIQQQQQEQQQMQLAGGMAEAAGKVAPFIKQMREGGGALGMGGGGGGGQQQSPAAA